MSFLSPQCRRRTEGVSILLIINSLLTVCQALFKVLVQGGRRVTADRVSDKMAAELTPQVGVTVTLQEQSSGGWGWKSDQRELRRVGGGKGETVRGDNSSTHSRHFAEKCFVK